MVPSAAPCMPSMEVSIQEFVRRFEVRGSVVVTTTDMPGGMMSPITVPVIGAMSGSGTVIAKFGNSCAFVPEPQKNAKA
jgi:hypothetical protein